MRCPDEVLKRLKSWNISDAEILMHFELSKPRVSLSFTGIVNAVEETDVHLAGLDAKTEVRLLVCLDDVEQADVAERPPRVHVKFREGDLMLALSPTARGQRPS